jgi:hypothetical protein
MKSAPGETTAMAGSAEMSMTASRTLACISLALTLVAGSASAQADNYDGARPLVTGKKHDKERQRSGGVQRDCRPFNGPIGYYGNPWCEGGWLSSEDRPPHWCTAQRGATAEFSHFVFHIALSDLGLTTWLAFIVHGLLALGLSSCYWDAGLHRLGFGVL